MRTGAKTATDDFGTWAKMLPSAASTVGLELYSSENRSRCSAGSALSAGITDAGGRSGILAPAFDLGTWKGMRAGRPPKQYIRCSLRTNTIRLVFVVVFVLASPYSINRMPSVK